VDGAFSFEARGETHRSAPARSRPGNTARVTNLSTWGEPRREGGADELALPAASIGRNTAARCEECDRLGQGLTLRFLTVFFFFSPLSIAFLGSRDAQRRAHDTLNMSSDAAHTAMTAAIGGLAIVTTPASLADAQDAIPGLPDHVVVTHILRSEYFDDPADLARLPAVSRAMRDAVADTGLQFEELDEWKAAELGCLSALKRRKRGGRLSYQERLCQAAARSGKLEELKVLRANGTPWDRSTCWTAAIGGHLEVLQWVHANGCPWDERTCWGAANGGHLEVLQWARANGCPWSGETCEFAAKGGDVEVLRWACANGCPYGEKDLFITAQHGHEAVVQVMIEAGANVNKEH
jgi:hypothetical protein